MKPGYWILAAAAIAASPASAGSSAAEVEETELSEVLITGSRLITNGNDMPTPVTVVPISDLEAVRPGNLAEALGDLPVFNGSRGQNASTGNGGGSPAGSANAANTVNMRQLGTLRTLILFDGHRAAPSTAEGFVDLDTIPQMLLKRIDVVTGGASAVYGSDAITGVVNFVTDTGFKGVRATLQAGRSQYGDADSAEGGIAFGTDLFDGRGHLVASYENHHQAPIDSLYARPWGNDVYTMQGWGSAAEPYFQVAGARISNATAGGRVTGAAGVSLFGDSQFTSGGYVVPFVHGGSLGLPNHVSLNCLACERGGDGGLQNGQLRASLDMNQLYSRLDFDFEDSLHGYVAAAGTLNRSVSIGDYVNAGAVICRDNAFLQARYQTASCAGAANQFTIGKIFTEIPRSQSESRASQLYVNAGLQGEAGRYNWDLSLTRSGSSFEIRRSALDQGRILAAVDSVLANGIPVCRASLTNPVYAGCIPMNPFGPNAASPESVAYVQTWVNYATNIGMEDAVASVAGPVMDTEAGPLKAALSAEWRRLTYEIDGTVSDAQSQRANCTGIAVVCGPMTPGLSFQIVTVPQVSQTVGEAAVEVELPLLKERRLARSLAVNGAYRFAHYDRAGNANTWKLGLTWTPVDSVTLRATRSRDLRAPSLDENFRATTINGPGRALADTLPGNPDSAAGQNPLATMRSRGNPDLQSEPADTLTYGIVIRPSPNFDIAVDAFHIRVKDAIFFVQGYAPPYQNRCYAGGGTSASNPGSSPFCLLIERNAAGSVTQWTSTFVNLAELKTSGADIELGFRGRLFARPLQLRLLTTYQPHLIQHLAGDVPSDYAGSSSGANGLQANPVWRATAFVTYQPSANLSISLQERWRSALTKVGGSPPWAAEPSIYVGDPVRAVAYTNLGVTWTSRLEKGAVDLFANIQNLFNTDPPASAARFAGVPGLEGGFAGGDDPIGRYYTLGVRYRL